VVHEAIGLVEVLDFGGVYASCMMVNEIHIIGEGSLRVAVIGLTDYT
jgi:hypothetical protein